jgi:hypothetical protein
MKSSILNKGPFFSYEALGSYELEKRGNRKQLKVLRLQHMSERIRTEWKALYFPVAVPTTSHNIK